MPQAAPAALSPDKSPKWTPGPWRHVSTPGGWDGVKEANGPTNICLLSLNNPANATLIAAAPELYENLLNVVERFEITCRHLGNSEYAKVAISDARAALAKARGDAALSTEDAARVCPVFKTITGAR